ncbi:hypothetical protein COZ73_02910 [Candidatus Falkowbacteria bacterium CG_4_8_14_3_um_filter_36_11]|nr:MAG: hypothetical protein COZ73_02910 [Candidatus Falkowbacteria bacterium CG_4_8_14_3_um_filter_36_11]
MKENNLNLDKPITDEEAEKAVDGVNDADNDEEINKLFNGQEADNLSGKDIKDPNYEIKVKKEIENLPDEKRKEISIGLNNIGFFVEEKKDRFFSNIFKKISNKFNERTTMGRFTKSLHENMERDANQARKNIEKIEDGEKKHFSNLGRLSGNVLKYGRMATDVAGYTAGSSLKYVMMGGMIFSRGSEAAKEARFKNEKVIKKTRIKNINQAAEEAWSVYEKAKEKNDEVSHEDLEKAYQQNIPKNLLNRLSKNPEPGTASNILQKIIKKHIEYSINNINNKINAIDTDNNLSKLKKDEKKNKIINKYSKKLKDFDRVVSQYGTVDELAMGAKYLETGSKAVVYGMMAETLTITATKLWEKLPDILSPDELEAADIQGVPSVAEENLTESNLSQEDAMINERLKFAGFRGDINNIEEIKKWVEDEINTNGLEHIKELGLKSFAEEISKAKILYNNALHENLSGFKDMQGNSIGYSEFDEIKNLSAEEINKRFPEQGTKIFEAIKKVKPYENLYNDQINDSIETIKADQRAIEPMAKISENGMSMPEDPNAITEIAEKFPITEGEPSLEQVEIIRGLKNEFTLHLGKGDVPPQLEKVFHMIAVDSRKDVLGANNMFGEEEGAKSLNVAANLVKLSEKSTGSVAGVPVEDFRQAVNYDELSGRLDIKDHVRFNSIIAKLNEQSDKLWEDGKLQKGAVAYLNDIKHDTWKKIVDAEGLEKAEAYKGPGAAIEETSAHETVPADAEHIKESFIKANEAMQANSSVHEMIGKTSGQEAEPLDHIDVPANKPELADTMVYGVAGHDEISDEQIMDFDKSNLVHEAERAMTRAEIETPANITEQTNQPLSEEEIVAGFKKLPGTEYTTNEQLFKLKNDVEIILQKYQQPLLGLHDVEMKKSLVRLIYNTHDKEALNKLVGNNYNTDEFSDRTVYYNKNGDLKINFNRGFLKKDVNLIIDNDGTFFVKGPKEFLWNGGERKFISEEDLKSAVKFINQTPETIPAGAVTAAGAETVVDAPAESVPKGTDAKLIIEKTDKTMLTTNNEEAEIRVKPPIEVNPENIKEGIENMVGSEPSMKDIELKNGRISFTYDEKGNILSYHENIDSYQQGNEEKAILNEDYRAKIIDKLSGKKTGVNLDIRRVDAQSAAITEKIKMYEELKNTGYKKEADMVAETIKINIKQLENQYGDIFKDIKL